MLFCLVCIIRGYGLKNSGQYEPVQYKADENDVAILNELQKRFEVQITDMSDEIDVSTYSNEDFFFFISIPLIFFFQSKIVNYLVLFVQMKYVNFLFLVLVIVIITFRSFSFLFW